MLSLSGSAVALTAILCASSSLAQSLTGSASALPSPSSTANATSNATLPIVDLGYELHRASFYNASGQFYNFSNIRYAQPPVGNLRWKPPQPPLVNRSVVQDGGSGRICPQANPSWTAISTQYLPQYLLTGRTQYNESSFNLTGISDPPPEDPRTTEDCLFLDVVVPQDIFNTAGLGYGAPVLVWIYGGGYTEGSKSDSGNPAGLLARSENNNGGVIYVSLNYRLGAFGWLAGPTLQSSGGVANAGLYDQRLALEWVREHISKFGGDPNRVTVFGESAGGGSITHQITAFGNSTPPPFQQAVIQSPGWFPIVSSVTQEQAYADFLKLMNVSTLDQARRLPFEQLQAANVAQVGAAPYGQFVYGPVVDGVFTPSLPGQMLARGQFPKDLRIMVGHNINEGLLFTSPFIQNNTKFNQQLESLAPNLQIYPDILNYVTETLYPPTFDGSQGYTNQIARAAQLIAEVVFTCNTFYLDKAYLNNTYAYLFAIPPGLHGFDIPYTYFNGPTPGFLAPETAITLQEYITHFAEFGYPSEVGVPVFPMYTNNASIQVLNVSSVRLATDPTANSRCNWWQKALYY